MGMMESRTYIAVPPGATIKEQLDDRGMTQKEFAARMDMSQKHVCKLVNGSVQLTPDTAHKLELVLGVPASFWNNLESHYREQLVKATDENEMDEDVKLSKLFPYRDMMKLGWIPETRKSVERVTYLRQFFEVVRLSLVGDGLVPRVAYRRKANATDRALWAWAQKARIEARDIDVAPINTGLLEEKLPAIRAMTTRNPKEFCPELADALAECGVAIVFLPHLPNTGVQGATFRDGGKIVCAMTVRGKNADRFWFSLFHELGHIMCGHVSELHGTTKSQEQEADAFARDWLISPEAIERFESEGKFTRQSVVAFAKESGIAPGIVVGRLQNDRLLGYDQLGSLKVQYALVDY